MCCSWIIIISFIRAISYADSTFIGCNDISFLASFVVGMQEEKRFSLEIERLGPLPIINHFLDRLGLDERLEKYVPTNDGRTKIPYAKGLGLLLRSILVEREPIYRQQEIVEGFAPSAFRISRTAVKDLTDDQLGRSLDRLFSADRGSLLTACMVNAVREFRISLKELHNDSTSISLFGQYPQAKGRTIRGRRAPWVTYGHSKDHRPDLKQILFILTTNVDGGVPVQFRCEDGNTSDAVTHVDTWKTLRDLNGGPNFLYVADSKLCTLDNMETINNLGGRFVTVLPRSRQEDRQFRKWVQEHEVPWVIVRNDPNPRRKYGPRDIWKVYRSEVPSCEVWPITWVYSTLLALHHRHRRQQNIQAASEELSEMRKKLTGQRPRIKTKFAAEQKVQAILAQYHVKEYLKAKVLEFDDPQFKQETPGRPGPETRYIREDRRRLTIRYEVDEEAVQRDQASDGMYPLLSNDKNLTPKEVFEAHKRQPKIERRFRDVKSVFEIAPVFLKNEGRIEALFFLYFLVLLVESIIEREFRQAMEREDIEHLPLYPEQRLCRRPTATRLFELFTLTQRMVLKDDAQECQVFEHNFTELQIQVLKLLRIPMAAFRRG
jgi:transposase